MHLCCLFPAPNDTFIGLSFDAFFMGTIRSVDLNEAANDDYDKQGSEYGEDNLGLFLFFATLWVGKGIRNSFWCIFDPSTK